MHLFIVTKNFSMCQTGYNKDLQHTESKSCYAGMNLVFRT